ncbi:MAG: CBS domain-containing protein [Actinomycetota bacterium]
MKVDDVMRRWFERLDIGSRVLEAARLMVFTGQQALPVVEGARLAGMIAERDIFDALLRETSRDVYAWGLSGIDPEVLSAYRGLLNRPVAEIMSQKVLTVGPDTLALRAAGLMRARRIQRLPVVAGDDLLGLVFQSDIHHAMLAAAPRSEGDPGEPRDT